ncbi:MAG: HEAT repeat domain-containing protein [Lachnospiraceae bacterium]|nr:HEAT repeat domain-containing protein [Lachnospiraceae bacterium]
MIKEYYEKICAGDEVRANLISLRNELKDEKNRREFAYLLGGDFSKLCVLLKSEDPKVRKNAALVLGKLESEDLLPVLFDAWQKEETLFIRADYLKAMSELDFRPLAEQLEKRLTELREVSAWPPEEWKHVSEEIRMLQAMVLRCHGIRHHRFSGGKEKEDVILLTNRRQREATAEQISKGKITMLAGGLRVDGAPLKEIRPIRTYSEMLFPLKTESLPAASPERCGELLANPVLTFADRMYNGAGAFLYRIELRDGAAGTTADSTSRKNLTTRSDHAASEAGKGTMPVEDKPFPASSHRREESESSSKTSAAHHARDMFCAGEFWEKRGVYLRRISSALERASDARLVNSVTDYEIEIRLVLRRDGTFAAMLKLSSSLDERFAYRKEQVAASIAPVNAALAVRLAQPWLKENAQILDPFCGVGTMLIERDRAVKAGTMYGLDIFAEAIDKARRNTERAECRIHYINRDFFTFQHEYLFDEVITDMPRSVSVGTAAAAADMGAGAAPTPDRHALRKLYHDFFHTIGRLLKEEAVLVIYTTEPNYVVESVRSARDFRIEKSFLLNEKNHTTVFVILRSVCCLPGAGPIIA